MPKVNRSGQAKVLSDSEITKIRRNLRMPHHKLIFDILRYTGERIGAVLQLEKLDVYDRKGNPRKYITFRARTRKAAAGLPAKTRQVVVHTSLRDSLKVYPLPKNSLWLFPSQDNPENHLLRQSVDAVFRRACNKAGLGDEGISSHSFRRSLMTKLSNNGVSARTIQEITGHASLASVQKYIEVDEAAIESAINLL